MLVSGPKSFQRKLLAIKINDCTKDERMHKDRDKVRIHEPVLLKEVIEGLGLNLAPLNTQDTSIYEAKATFIDATVGAGGHSAEIIKRGAFVLGIDADEGMLEVARKNLELVLRAMRLSEPKACPTGNFAKHFKLVCGNFRNLDTIARDARVENVSGVLFDLGLASYHYDFDQRGFSFNNPQNPLDMRLSPDTQTVTASMLLNSLPKKALEELFEEVLPKHQAIKLESAVLRRREHFPLVNVGDFLEVIHDAGIRRKKSKRIGSIKESTLAFLALRMAVNTELENLFVALPKAYELMCHGGRLIVISFHSGEDKIVKNFFKKTAADNLGKLITKKPLRPGLSELESNPRSRSAKLRILEKI
jgi:16S rRNA (cytosine1402-N4)-methyltransferase